MSCGIAIVGMACRYPDAKSPQELWHNALAKRRAFRRMPDVRLNNHDYLSPDRFEPDKSYLTEAAVIEGYEFDRVAFKVVGSTYRSADLAHWLALDIAAQALFDAGFPNGDGLPKESTGVVLGNTLTGEFSRANVMRLRWPYVNRVVNSALEDKGWSNEDRADFMALLEKQYKTPFPEIGEETLSGGLSNTIAGRICNHFDLQGGGYTIDGACASSVLSVSTACSSIVAGDLDVAIAGGVDLSLDPFELVGFAKTGALAPDEMRVYDERSAGFWPGEGCGFVVLMHLDEAITQSKRIYAVIRGWGVSSDGAGGITRPDENGQLLALDRAYRRAGYSIDTVFYFEGHGTGTAVGDTTELGVLSRARREANSKALPAVISTIKANIGHTKAAAGVAGLIKTTMALHTKLLPPATGCLRPHRLLVDEHPMLCLLEKGKPWPDGQPVRAGVSAMGFGGINTHLTLESAEQTPRIAVTVPEQNALRSEQDAEIFVFQGSSLDALREQATQIADYAADISRAELIDLAAALAVRIGTGSWRAAVVASTPKEMASRLHELIRRLENCEHVIETTEGIFFSASNQTPRIGFLFPGQGSPAHISGGMMRRRFDTVNDLYEHSDLPDVHDHDEIATDVAQPAIVTASLAGLKVLHTLGINATAAIGHSLGELTALHWAGAFDEAALLRIATARGRAMADLGDPTGAMASIAAGSDVVETLLSGVDARIAGYNAPSQTVVSGDVNAVNDVMKRAASKDIRATRLPVSHAFHSPLVAVAAAPLAEHLAGETIEVLHSKVYSTISGAELNGDEDVRDLLRRQVTEPVRFTDAINAMRDEIDLFIEVGPGNVIRGLADQSVEAPCVSMDAGGESLVGLLNAVAVALVLGAPVNLAALFDDRLTRLFELNWQPIFFINPCELAPQLTLDASQEPARSLVKNTSAQTVFDKQSIKFDTPLELVRLLVAERAELPQESIEPDHRLLSDLHLNSIVVGELVVQAARQMQMPPPAAPTEFADATVRQVAVALEEMKERGVQRIRRTKYPPGIETWVRTYTTDLVERPRPGSAMQVSLGDGCVIALPGHPFADRLELALHEHAAELGVAVCLNPGLDEQNIRILLEGVKLVVDDDAFSRFLVVQQGGGGAAFSRTLRLECPHVSTCVVDLPEGEVTDEMIRWVVDEALAATGYVEAHYDSDGTRRVPILRLNEYQEEVVSNVLFADDVLLVTGGGKGIAAECALAMAEEYGCALILLGRSQPEVDEMLARNLNRFEKAEVRFQYVCADVCDADVVTTTLECAQQEMGSVTAILHAAGNNRPQLLSALDENAFAETLTPKVNGLRHVLGAVDETKLKLLINFGSIIARMGLPGEAHYALANEWLELFTRNWQQEHTSCRCHTLQWSIWSGAGMGERVGRLDALLHEGINPISIEAGIETLIELLRHNAPVSPVITARFGDPKTLDLARPELPLLRFLERPKVYYPQVELVTEAELSLTSDPYLKDHVFQRQKLLPGVIGLEAMAQVATALAESSGPVSFTDIQFNRPVIVPDDGSTIIRLAALVRRSGKIDVVLRCATTDFQIDHFRATCHIEASTPLNPTIETHTASDLLELNPSSDLYGRIMFQSGRFKRIESYEILHAESCSAILTSDGTMDWFDRYMPNKLILGDPGLRDATIHAIQACIPHRTLLPMSVDRLSIIRSGGEGKYRVCAVQRLRDGDTFVYDAELIDSDGVVVERWEGLRLRAVEPIATFDRWPAPLLEPYLQRSLEELLSDLNIHIAVNQCSAVAGREQTDQAIESLTGKNEKILRRPDGKPIVTGGHVSAAHDGDLTVAMSGDVAIGCDVEPITSRDQQTWLDLLGTERMALVSVVCKETEESFNTAATRIWSAQEALVKTGVPPDSQTPLILSALHDDGWVMFKSGVLTIASCVLHIRDRASPCVFAMAATGELSKMPAG